MSSAGKGDTLTQHYEDINGEVHYRLIQMVDLLKLMY